MPPARVLTMHQCMHGGAGGPPRGGDPYSANIHTFLLPCACVRDHIAYSCALRRAGPGSWVTRVEEVTSRATAVSGSGRTRAGAWLRSRLRGIRGLSARGVNYGGPRQLQPAFDGRAAVVNAEPDVPVGTTERLLGKPSVLGPRHGSDKSLPTGPELAEHFER